MARAKRLDRRQHVLMDDLFAAECEEHRILEKHRIGRQVFRKWLAGGEFREELNERVAGGYRLSALFLARSAPLAAKKLMNLTDCDKVETARKACIDIITMRPQVFPPTGDPAPDGEIKDLPSIHSQAASRLMAALAQENMVVLTGQH